MDAKQRGVNALVKTYIVTVYDYTASNERWLQYSFEDMEEACGFIKLSVANGYTCTIYEDKEA